MKDLFIMQENEIQSRDEVFNKVANLLKEKGLIKDPNDLVSKLQDREKQVSTGFEHGIAIPHAICDEVKKPIIVIFKTGDIDWPSMDKQPTNFIITLIIPKNGEGTHLKILSSLTRNIVIDDFRKKLLAGSEREIIECINSVEFENKESVEKKVGAKHYIGVTKCPVGIAHTYMAAEKLETTAKKLGYTMKVETQGSQGIENRLTDEDIKNADGVIIAADVSIEERERFTGKKVIEVAIKRTLKNTELLFDEIEVAPVVNFGNNNSSNIETKANNSIMKFIMNGVSHMIPFVVVGGLCIALSLSLGGEPTATGLVIPDGSIWNKMLEIGGFGFQLMIPILAGYTAFAIAGRAALAPAMLGAMVANSPEVLGTSAGTGFIGAILVGVLVGYLVRWMNTWKVKKEIKPIMPIFVIPLLATLVISLLFIFVIGKPVEIFTTGLENGLSYMAASPALAVPLGFLLGAMLAFDMGGPVNKVAFLFGVASIASGSPEIMGAVAAGGGVPPLATGAATFIKPKKFTSEDNGSGLAALIMGFIGITEGAIPFAANYPKIIIPSIMIGGGCAGALAMILGITANVPHTGPIIGLLGAVNNLPLYLLCILFGTVVGTTLILIFKKDNVE
ncbi:MAG: PTS fructose transporter subunit IIABC [Mycoplasmatales bacterium]